ncbi:hypothetical protein OG203_37955 [Nocardia sp. NBC_01499]|uniref:hypothetical protein n=1 Tax=Nocardia sp. NBC_01499 TaxID=2903597 RepID=UPI0038681691
MSKTNPLHKGRKNIHAWYGLALLSVAAIGSVTAGAGIGHASGNTATDCLWAGSPHPQGAAISAGGWNFSCGTGANGPRWILGAATGAPSTVPNPGAATYPTGQFSDGALQPGTDYEDYCVGTEMVGGGEEMYEATLDDTGTLYWKAAGPISQWTFAPGTGPTPTSSDASLCLPDQ